jgi:glycosyltransferase involved in cell wall biosynthesis
MKLVMITPRVDSSDPVHGFIVGWVKALARRVEHLWVVTPRAGKESLPGNVTVREVGRDYSKGETIFHALRNFHHVMWHLTHTERVDGIFTHMYPKFAILVAPYAKLRRLPLVMWHTHTHVSRQLWLAEKLVDRIVTASRGSCRLDSDKIRVLGHGIDTNRFLPAPLSQRLDQPFTVLSVGRISPAKRYEVIIEAFARLTSQGHASPLCLRLVGDAPTVEHQSYLQELEHLIVLRGLSGCVHFESAVPYSQIIPVYQQADVFVSASQTGLDKAVLEAMACGLVPIISLPDFAPMLGDYADLLMYEPGNTAALTDRLAKVLAMPAVEREQIGQSLRIIVQSAHDVDILMSKLVCLFEELQGKAQEPA